MDGFPVKCVLVTNACVEHIAIFHCEHTPIRLVFSLNIEGHSTHYQTMNRERSSAAVMYCVNVEEVYYVNEVLIFLELEFNFSSTL